MKTVLDLIGEFAALNDSKVMCGGKLPPELEERWEELKGFYDLLMSQSGIAPRPVTRRFCAEDVLAKVRTRDRLRVPLETELVFKFREDLHVAMGVNLSRGGVFLSANQLAPVQESVTVYLSTPDRVDDALLEAQGEVAWVTEQGVARSSLPRGMGISFVGKKTFLARYLDALVVDSLVRRLSGVDANALAPEFLLKEQIEL